MKTKKKVWFGPLLAVLILLLIGAFYLDGNDSDNEWQTLGAIHRVGPYRVKLKLMPEQPKIGQNHLTLAIRDDENRPVVNATVRATAEMPAMGAMPAMVETIEIENTGAGIYRGRFSLPMNGSWPLTVTIDSTPFGQTELGFDMNTSRTGVRLTTPSTDTSTQTQATNAEARQSATFTITHQRRQLIGVTTATVDCRHLIKVIRAGARITYDESKLTDVSLKYDGWIGELYADHLGQQVRQGETLFTIYNPELLSAQDEYLDSLKRGAVSGHGLRKAARRRLARWGIGPMEITALEKRGRAIDYLPIKAQTGGTLIEKSVVTGSAAKAGMRLLRLADLSSVWVEGRIYQSELPWIKPGMAAQVQLPEHPGLNFDATVDFIDPILDADNRSAAVRVTLANPDGNLRPNMFARLNLRVDLGERLVVPEQAVIYAGDKRIVFLDRGQGRLEPRAIETGLRNDDFIEVRDGLAIGDIVVTSGNFLIAAESKMKAGLAPW